MHGTIRCLPLHRLLSQREAQSADGTMIPYFLVVKGEVPTTGECKTVLYGYGGFEVSLQPGYSGEVGVAWLEAGHCYVVANIRCVCARVSVSVCVCVCV